MSLDLTTRKFVVEVEQSYYTGSFVDTGEYVYAVCGDKEPVKLFLHKSNNAKSIAEIPQYLAQSNLEYHPEGFPEFVVYGASKYAYSRSHHGNYYISAMSEFSHN